MLELDVLLIASEKLSPFRVAPPGTNKNPLAGSFFLTPSKYLLSLSSTMKSKEVIGPV